MVRGQNLKARIWQIMQALPVSALLAGLVMIPLRPQFEAYGKPIYEILKFLMSFLGMAILGIWISVTPIRLSDFRQALLLFALVSLLIVICRHLDIGLVLENKPTLYLLCLLPPAANIAVLETHYLKSGRSASLIACGTCLSIAAISVYAAAVLFVRQNLGV